MSTKVTVTTECFADGELIADCLTGEVNREAIADIEFCITIEEEKDDPVVEGTESFNEKALRAIQRQVLHTENIEEESLRRLIQRGTADLVTVYSARIIELENELAGRLADQGEK